MVNQIFFGATQTAGENEIWFIDGTDTSEFSLSDLDSQWSYTLGDFNGDSRTDLLWRNETTGENTIWLMNGILFLSASLDNLDASWKPSVGDFNGDGQN